LSKQLETINQLLNSVKFNVTNAGPSGIDYHFSTETLQCAVRCIKSVCKYKQN